MITPPFVITQEVDFIKVELTVPHIKAKEIDFYIDESVFKFHCRPYFLRLMFQQKLVEDGKEKASYDYGTGILTLRLPKLIPGEDFTGLEDLNSLVSKKAVVNEEGQQNRPAIEVLQSEDQDWEDEDIDWQIEQKLNDVPVTDLLGKPHYGFNQHASNYFAPLQDELSEFMELRTPDETPSVDRSGLRKKTEDERWNEEHYMMDFVEDDMIEEIIRYIPAWTKLKNAEKKTSMSPADILQGGDSTHLQFDQEEKNILVSLPSKTYLKDATQDKMSLCGLASILYAYAYDCRANMGQKNVESAWNITFLCPVFCWLEVFNNLRSTMVASYRRSLNYPLYRNWNLSTTVQKDVVNILSLGKRYTLKMIVDIKKLFDRSEFFYHYSRLFLDDYCRWLQSVSSKKIRELSEELSKVDVTKEEMAWNLKEIEDEALQRVMAQEDE